MIGAPLLLSNDKSGSLLSRTSMRRDPAVETYEETLLQEIIDRWPDILPICDFLPSVSSVCSLGREIPAGLGESDGFIDNLLVTDDGHLVIVETKLWRNPDALRKVIAQTLQYGMAVTQMTLDEFENHVRRGDPKDGVLVWMKLFCTVQPICYQRKLMILKMCSIDSVGMATFSC